MSKEDLEDEEKLHEQLAEAQVLGKKKQTSKFHNRRVDFQKEHFENMVHELHEKKKREAEMDEE